MNKTLKDKRAHSLLFALLGTGRKFDFDYMLLLWFNGREATLVDFLEWLDEQGLEIRKKNAQV